MLDLGDGVEREPMLKELSLVRLGSRTLWAWCGPEEEQSQVGRGGGINNFFLVSDLSMFGHVPRDVEGQNIGFAKVDLQLFPGIEGV